MKLLDYTIRDVIYAIDETVVALADTVSGDKVILKYLDQARPSLDIGARWQHEYDILRSIDSPWIIKALGLHQIDARFVLVLEYFAPTNLAQVIADYKTDLAARLQIAIQLAHAISDVHRHGLIHGDISPKNVLIDAATYQLKLCDFGLATRLAQVRKNEGASWMRGTLQYMSPEQTGRTDLSVDYRSDFYSLGVTLYELFLGEKPFQSNEPMTLLHAHIALSPKPLHEVDSSIPKVLSDIVSRLMAKLPDDRYQSSKGLQNDLTHCAHQWAQHWRIDGFDLALQDVPERFFPSQRLYGREHETAQILAAFERVGNGRSELLLLGGYSGVGKTALVSELHKPILAKQGWFIRGKCDQYSRNQPFGALIQAFAPVVRQLLSESAPRRLHWKLALQRALGENVGALTEIIANLALIVGDVAPLQPLPAIEQESRFHLAFEQFMSTLATPAQPLVLFLDDLQWVDQPTLKLIERQIANEDARALLVIGAYRDNEVDETHPLMLTEQALRLAQAPVHSLLLQPLDLANVTPFVADSLHRAPDDIATLAALCIERTGGNPFFLKQFLCTLDENGDLYYDRGNGQWQWNLQRIQQRGMTDNVVDLMLEKLRKFELDTQTLLSLAAHLGRRFDLRQLMAASAQDATTTAAQLWPALRSGLLTPLSDDYQFAATPAKLEDSSYAFLHDRVQQAAYSLTPEHRRKAVQLTAGRRLLALSNELQLTERLFTILELLNDAKDLIDDPLERAQLLALNLRAGIHAKAASAHPLAVSLLAQAKRLLTHDAWLVQPEQTLSVYQEYAEALYLAGDFALAEQVFHEGFSGTNEAAAKVSMSLVQADQLHIQGRFAESTLLLQQALGLLGRPFPATDEVAGAMLPAEFGNTEQQLQPRALQSLLLDPELTDPLRILEMRVYYALSFATYQTGKFAMFLLGACRMVQVTLRYGQSDLSSIAYVAYVTAMSAMGKTYPQCYAMGRLASTLAEARDSKYVRLTIYQYYSAFYQHWCEPLENTFGPLERGVDLGHEGINPLSAGFCTLLRSVNRFSKGRRLDLLEAECEAGLKFLERSQQPNTEGMLRYGLWMPILALQGKTSAPLNFETATDSTQAFFKGDYQTPSITLALYSCAMLQQAYLLDDRAKWQQFCANLPMIGMCLPDSPSLVDATFYVALGLLNPATADSATAQQNLEQATKYCEKFELWARDCEPNFAHKHLLLAAEIARVRGEDKQAMDLYARAIAAAKRADFAVCSALANALYAKFWRGQHQEQLACNFILEAHALFGRWGAKVLCQALELQWPKVTFGFTTRRTMHGDKTTSFPVVSGTIDTLDLHSLLKASQLLAQEVHLEALLQKMMTLLLENAGADQGAIVLVDDGQLELAAIGKTGVEQGAQKAVVQTQGKNAALHTDGSQYASLLPLSIVHYVRDSRETLCLTQPAQDQRFMGEDYLAKRQPKSVLCLPVISQGKLVAVVYLENNLLEGAFTTRHQKTLELLSAQAAISLVNARLYTSLEAKVLQRTEQLRQMSMKDGLTGIANRRAFDERLSADWDLSQRSGEPLALLMIDIDHFKEYNDHYGHLQGDYCIRAVAKALERTAGRAADFVARYGGEEFAVLLTNTDLAGAARIAQACLQAVAALEVQHEKSLVAPTVSISIGVRSLSATTVQSADTLIAQADEALYRSKRGGRNCITFFEELPSS